MPKVKSDKEHIKLLKKKLKRLLDWPNPSGTIKDAYIPGWLKKECEDAIKGNFDLHDEDMDLRELLLTQAYLEEKK